MKELAQRLVRAAKRELLPRDRVRVKETRFESLIITSEASADHRRGVDDDDGRASCVGVDVDQAPEPDVEPRFLARFADRRGLHLFAAVDVAAGEDPFPVTGVDRASNEDETARQIEAGRRAITRYVRRGGKLWIRVFPDKPFTQKPPEVKLGAHVAALGMRFYTGTQFPAQYRNNIFIAEHGSWNRKPRSGYKPLIPDP